MAAYCNQCQQINLAQKISSTINASQEDIQNLMNHYFDSYQNQPFTAPPLCS